MKTEKLTPMYKREENHEIPFKESLIKTIK
jgi:hypothetical protein